MSSNNCRRDCEEKDAKSNEMRGEEISMRRGVLDARDNIGRKMAE